MYVATSFAIDSELSVLCEPRSNRCCVYWNGWTTVVDWSRSAFLFTFFAVLCLILSLSFVDDVNIFVTDPTGWICCTFVPRQRVDVALHFTFESLTVNQEHILLSCHKATIVWYCMVWPVTVLLSAARPTFLLDVKGEALQSMLNRRLRYDRSKATEDRQSTDTVSRYVAKSTGTVLSYVPVKVCSVVVCVYTVHTCLSCSSERV